MELGQGERCGCDHVSAKPSGARLKYRYASGPKELETGEERPCAEPEDQQRFDHAECGFIFDPYPAALAPDFLPVLLRIEIDNVVLHIDWSNFINRTQARCEKLHNSAEILLQRESRVARRADGLGPGPPDSTASSSNYSRSKVSFDARGSVDIAFPPQIQVRWLSGRKRRFAKALYLKRVPRVRIPPSPVFSLRRTAPVLDPRAEPREIQG